LQDRRTREDKEAVRVRVERHRARKREALLERERLVDWEFATGEDLPALTARELLALWAWRADPRVRIVRRVGTTQRFTYRVRGDFGWIEPWWYYPLVTPSLRWVDRSGECWIARVDAQTQWGSESERQATLSTLTKGWGRVLRWVQDKDGKRCQVPAARAVGPAYTVLVTPELDLLYRGALIWEYQRWRWHQPGDWSARYWDTPALTQWNDKVNRAFLKAAHMTRFIVLLRDKAATVYRVNVKARACFWGPYSCGWRD
jgi:hypothetical protein